MIVLPIDASAVAESHAQRTLTEAISHANRALAEVQALDARHDVADSVFIAVVRLTHAASCLGQRAAGR